MKQVTFTMKLEHNYNTNKIILISIKFQNIYSAGEIQNDLQKNLLELTQYGS